MGKTLKVLGWLIGMLLLLIISAIILVPMFVDVNDHKDRIIVEVKKATGRDLSIDGEIGLSVFPRFMLELNGLSLSNAAGFKEGDFAAVEHVGVRVDMLPLIFQQRLQVETVEIEGLNLNLARSKSGATNWDDMLGREGTGEIAEPGSATAPSEGGLPAFSIGGVAIKDASIVWDDQSTGEHYQVANLRLETGAIAPGRSVDVAFGVEIESAKPVLRAKLGMTGRMQVSTTHQAFGLDDLLLKASVTGEGLPEEGVAAELAGDLRFNQKDETLEFKTFRLASGKLNLEGDLLGHTVISNPRFEGELRLAKFDPREWMEAFNIAPPETADPEVLGSLELSSHFTGDVDQLVLKQLFLKLDQTTVKGGFEIIDFADPAYHFDLGVDRINLDRYLPPSREGGQTAAGGGAGGTGGGDEELIPTQLLRQLKLDGALLVDRLTINKVHAEAVQLKIRARNGKVSIDQQIGRFYDGLQKGNISIDASGERPQMKVTQKLSRVLAGPLLQDLTGKDKLLGSGDVDLDLSSRGASVNQIKRTLNGKVSFDFRDGAVKGFNLAKMLRDTRAKLSGESTLLSNEPEQTDFSELTGTASINNGVINNQRLFAKSPYLRVEGSGTADLLQERLDYSIRPVLVNTPQGQGGKGLEDLVGVPIPVRIHGAWADPQFNIQLAQILEERQKARLQEKLDEKLDEKLKEKVPEGLQDKLKGKLKKLF